jgi:hypothetical protein
VPIADCPEAFDRELVAFLAAGESRQAVAGAGDRQK